MKTNMQRTTSRLLMILMLVLIGSTVGTQRASAQFGGVTYCTNCSTWMTQLQQEIYEYESMYQDTMGQVTRLQQLQNQIKMMTTTPSQVFSKVSGILNTLQSVSKGGQALSASMTNLDNQFTSTFAAAGYAPTTSYASQYTSWTNTSLQSTQKALDVAQQANTNQNDEADLISDLQDQASSSDAAVSTVQVTNQITSEMLNQLMEMRQLMMSDMASKAAFQAQQIKEHDTAAQSAGMFQDSGPSISTVNTFGSTLNTGTGSN
jgi:type IV secretion system protein TrbJ